MTATNRANLTPLIDAVLTATSADITQGLTQADVEWVLAAYRHTILPYRLRQAQEAPLNVQKATGRLVIAELRELLSPLAPDERLRFIVRTYYWIVLAPFSDAAFEVARRFVERTGDDERLRHEAQRTLRTIDTFINRVRQESPLALVALRPELSEAVLDCRFVLNETPFVSRRLNRYVDHLAARRRRCPRCGFEPPGTAKFCTECGTRLRG